MANSKLYPTSSPASISTRTQTGANAADCRPEAIRPVNLIPAGAGQADATPAPAAAPRPTLAPTPYHCAACGSDSPYVGLKPVHKGGCGCKVCSQVEKAINAALSTAMRAVSAEAYRDNLTGSAKLAVMKRAEQAGREAWRAAQISFGIDLEREDQIAAAVAPVLAADPTPEVHVHYIGPWEFGVSAIGGTFEDLHGAIVQQMRSMVATGLIGPGELTAVGTSLLDTAQDMSLATAWEAAQVTGSCPECCGDNINIFDIEGRRSYVCRDCGARWT